MTVAALAALAGGCALESSEVREVRRAAQEYLRALAHRDLKEIGARSTCVASTNSLVGGRVLAIDPPVRIRMATLDSLARAATLLQRSADSAWAKAEEALADSLFRKAQLVSNRAALYRNAARAAPASAPGFVLSRDTFLEARRVRARIRYAGPLVGPGSVDREEIIRLLKAPGGTWIVFGFCLVSDDPRPEMI